MMFTSKKRLAIAVSGAVSLGATVAHAVDFNATTTLQNTLAVTVVQDFDLGTVFATATGAGLTHGVGGFVIAPADGVTDDTAFTGPVSLQSLTAPTPAQGSVDTIGEFTLTLPNTTAIDPADFPDNGTSTSLAEVTAEPATTPATTEVVELVHESGDPGVPSLYMLHFTIADTNDGDSTITPGTTNDGQFTIEPAFGVTTYNFNIGATVITEPTAAAVTYQEGVYSGTFEVTAAY